MLYQWNDVTLLAFPFVIASGIGFTYGCIALAAGINKKWDTEVTGAIIGWGLWFLGLELAIGWPTLIF